MFVCFCRRTPSTGFAFCVHLPFGKIDNNNNNQEDVRLGASISSVLQCRRHVINTNCFCIAL